MPAVFKGHFVRYLHTLFIWVLLILALSYVTLGAIRCQLGNNNNYEDRSYGARRDDRRDDYEGTRGNDGPYRNGSARPFRSRYQRGRLNATGGDEYGYAGPDFREDDFEAFDEYRTAPHSAAAFDERLIEEPYDDDEGPRSRNQSGRGFNNPRNYSGHDRPRGGNPVSRRNGTAKSPLRAPNNENREDDFDGEEFVDDDRRPSSYRGRDDPRNGKMRGRPQDYNGGDSGRDRQRAKTCPIAISETRSSHDSIPTTSGSAIISTPSGDWVVYCSAVGKAILAYPLYCNGYGDDGIGKDGIHTIIENSCWRTFSVDDMSNIAKPVHLLIAMVKGHHSAAYQVDYDSGQLKLLPCNHVLDFKYLNDMDTLYLGSTGSLLAFSNDNPDSTARYQETIAPLYIARGGHLKICGFSDIQNTIAVSILKKTSDGQIIVGYIKQIGRTRRTIIALYSIQLMKGYCISKPYRKQPVIGTAPYKGQGNTLCAMEPFTLDQCMCGAQDLNFLTGAHPSQDHHLAVALANNVPEEDRVGCPLEELLSPDNAYNKGFCCCPPANGYSFVIAYDTKSKTFNQLAKNKKAFQEFYGGSPSVTEITQLQTEKCCPVVQLTSPLGPTELYTLERNKDGDVQVFSFINHDLPYFVQSSSHGYCDDNDIILSYTLNSFQSDEPDAPPCEYLDTEEQEMGHFDTEAGSFKSSVENTIYHLRCKDDSSYSYDRQYIKSYRSGGYSDRNKPSNSYDRRSVPRSVEDLSIDNSYPGEGRRFDADVPDHYDFRNNKSARLPRPMEDLPIYNSYPGERRRLNADVPDHYDFRNNKSAQLPVRTGPEHSYKPPSPIVGGLNWTVPFMGTNARPLLPPSPLYPSQPDGGSYLAGGPYQPSIAPRHQVTYDEEYKSGQGKGYGSPYG